MIFIRISVLYFNYDNVVTKPISFNPEPKGGPLQWNYSRGLQGYQDEAKQRDFPLRAYNKFRDYSETNKKVGGYPFATLDGKLLIS